MADREDQKKQLIIDYKQVFLTPQGERVLEDLTKKTSLKRTTIPESGPINKDRILVEEGKRLMILYINTMLDKNPYERKQSKAIDKENGK
jgi:hypothetical protein